MNTLDLILARTNLSLTIEKMKNSLDEVKKNTPEKVELISAREKTISDLTFSYIFFCELEAEYRLARQRNKDLEYNKMKDMERLAEIRQENQNIKDNVHDWIRSEFPDAQ